LAPKAVYGATRAIYTAGELVALELNVDAAKSIKDGNIDTVPPFAEKDTRDLVGGGADTALASNGTRPQVRQHGRDAAVLGLGGREQEGRSEAARDVRRSTSGGPSPGRSVNNRPRPSSVADRRLAHRPRHREQRCALSGS
jgi:hypothetical protein